MATEDQELQRWTEAVQNVVAQVKAWAEQQGWTAMVHPLTLTEDRLGSYQVSMLTVEGPAGRLVVEPVARWAAPGEGRVDVYSWPSLNRLMLIRSGSGAWTLMTEAGVRWPQPWGQATFYDLAASLNAAA